VGVLVKKADAVAFCAHFQGPQMGPLDAVDPATLAALGVTRLEGAALGKLDGQALAPAPSPWSGAKPSPPAPDCGAAGAPAFTPQSPCSP
jgi:hypothetical protein